ncbi:autotransporter assembly complex protein TamA [Henriciella aquimarina]|uniref:autotransporter assembly complex protein TamA n=1 Tax=Henriciella aquimarina TaxID=545261 RepID=UPI000A041BBC|nr:autotransporter assembly complex family protein [Henriciella aquimarina]
MARYTTALIAAVLLPALPAAAASVQVEFTGDYVTGDIEQAVRDALPDESTPETQLEARRQGRRAADAVRGKLNSLGHYDPRIDLSIESTEPPAARLRVDPGPSFSLETVTVEFDTPAPREESLSEIRQDLPVRAGRPAIPSEVIDAERWITSTLRNEGYPFAEVRERRVIGDREAETLAVTYIVHSGPRVQLGETTFPDGEELVTKTKYLHQLVPYEEGEIYSPDALSAFNTRLAETRMFKVARASLADEPSGTTESGDEIRDVHVTLTERPRHTIAFGASYSTNEGAGLNAEFTRRNLMRRGDTLTTELTMAEMKQALDVTWRRPNQFGYGRGLVLNTALIQELTDAYDRQAFTLGAAFEVVQSPDFTYSYGVNGELAHEEDEYGERDLQILSVFADGRLDKTDSLLDPRKGWRLNGRVEPSYTFGDETTPYVRSVAQISAYFPFDEARKFVLAGRFKAGAVTGASAANLPVDTRFYSGGGGSVRGYAYQGIGPRAEDGTPLGGKSLIEASLEARYAIREKIGVVAFVDAGNVSTEEFSDFNEARYGAGIGVRYSTPAGPIRLDVAAPLNPTDFDDPVQVYISIGQAF